MEYRLRKITDSAALDDRKLMDVYREDNEENAAVFFPMIRDKMTAVKLTEEEYLKYLKREFLRDPGNALWVLEADGVWVSALRTYPAAGNAQYIEAVETHPDHRRRGYAAKLLTDVLARLKQEGCVKVCDCVEKENTASLKLHERCGFRIARDPGYDYLAGEAEEDTFGMEILL